MKSLHLLLLAILLSGYVAPSTPSAPADWLAKPAVIVVMDEKDNVLDVHELDDAALAKDREIAFYETQGKVYLAFGRKVNELVRGRRVSSTMVPVTLDVYNGQIASIGGNTLTFANAVDDALFQKLDRYKAKPPARERKLYLDCPCPKDAGPVMNVRDTKALLLKIDPALQFREDSVDAFGIKTPIYAVEKTGPEERVSLSINVGRRQDELQPLTHVYIDVSTESPKDPKSVAEHEAWVRKYIGGFLEGGFADGKRLSDEVLGTIERMRTDPVVGKSIDIKGDYCNIQYTVWVPVEEIGRMELEHSLQIMENVAQLELNKAYEESQQKGAAREAPDDALAPTFK